MMFQSANAQVFEELDAIQSDSLIQSNSDNPGFVILDVRKPSEYNPQHLEGAINRNYYDNDFQEQIDSLDKNKTYLIHCKAGGRSSGAFDIMFDLGFQEVYNMKGGINAWKAVSLPTTDGFNPQLMFVTDSISLMKEIAIGKIDTFMITITNRANGLLELSNLCPIESDEFYTDFDPETKLKGSEDYSFHIFYEPIDEQADSLAYCIKNDAKTLNVRIYRTGIDQTSPTRFVELTRHEAFPNPGNDELNIKQSSSENSKIIIFNSNGAKVFERETDNSRTKIDISSWGTGTYIIHIRNEKENQIIRFVKL